MKKNIKTTAKSTKGGASMRINFISEVKKGSKKTAQRKALAKERKYKTNMLSYLYDLD